jgi:RNA-directed DNA polymerase
VTVHSNDRDKSGKTKLERLGELAELRKETVFNNLGHIINEELLVKIYHQMDGKKAVGIDGITKERYGKCLRDNIKNLLSRIRKGIYYPRPSRLTEIPKEDGSKRPLAVACFEDKLVQSAVSQILNKIYEPLFLTCSYGFRPARDCHDALRALMKHAYPCWNGAIVEIDICKYFNTIPHLELNKILQKKISDKRFLKLIDNLITTPTIKEDGEEIVNNIGCPQGSIISPVLSNIYLHEIIDTWFEELRKTYFKGKAEEIRFADDMVFVFENYFEAEKFFRVLPKRFEKFGLQMHADKSRLIQSGQNAAERANRAGKRLPTYKFLGFTVYWGKARNGKWWRMKFKSRSDRFTAKLKGLREYLKGQLNTEDTTATLKLVASVVRGWVNYHAVSDNERCVNQFIALSRQVVRKWLNRRGRKRPMSWAKFNKLMEKINFPLKGKTISIIPVAR